MFRTGNTLEAGLWLVIGFVFAVVAWRRVGRERSSCYAASITFVLFGLSDIVEISTGAWWRPWWLLVWKGLCVVSLVMLYIHHRNRRK